MLATKKVLRADKEPLVIQGVQDGTVVVSGTPSMVIVHECRNIRIQAGETEALKVSGASENKQNKHGAWLRRGLFTVIKSKDVSVGALDLDGATDDNTKDSWLKTVPNGFVTDPGSENIEVDSISGRKLHYGVMGRCLKFTVNGGLLEYISGDFIRATQNHIEINGVTGKYSLDVLPYEEEHRDAMQFWQENPEYTDSDGLKVQSNILIKNCTFWMPDHGHKWAKSSDGIMFTDGKYKNVLLDGNRMYTNGLHPDNGNGIRTDVTENFRVLANNIFDRADAVDLS